MILNITAATIGGSIIGVRIRLRKMFRPTICPLKATARNRPSPNSIDTAEHVYIAVFFSAFQKKGSRTISMKLPKPTKVRCPVRMLIV